MSHTDRLRSLVLLSLGTIMGCAEPGPLPAGTAPVDPPPEAVALDPADAMSLDLYGSSAHFGAALSFTADGRLMVGGPSVPRGPEQMAMSSDGVYLAAEPLPTELAWIRDPTADEGDPGYDDNLFGSGVLGPGDVTGDGIEDVAARTAYRSPPQGAYWSVFPGPDPTLDGVEYRLPWPTNGGTARCGDLDGDGVDELCVDNGIFFGPITDDDLPDLSWPRGTFHPLAAGDADADGAIDLFVGDAASSEIHRLASFPRSGESELAVLAADSWSIGTGMNALALGDLDADGASDLIAGTWTRVLVGPATGGGDLDANARTVLAVTAQAIAVGDFDGDGIDDVAVGGDSIVSVWLGPLPAGTLRLADADAVHMGLEYGEDGFGLALDAADTDGDGLWELAIGAGQDGEGFPEPRKGNLDVSHEHGRVWWLPGAGL